MRRSEPKNSDFNRMNIYISGSLAYDHIMNFPGHFKDHIMPDKIHIINLCFMVDGMEKKFGGTAGNIAYALALLGEKPLILATLGHDCQGYLDWLKGADLSREGVTIIEKEFTAAAFIVTDQADNQITAFNAGAMRYPSDYNFNHQMRLEKSLGIVSPGNLEDMIKYPSIFRKLGIKYIFDPGQSIPALTDEVIVRGIEGALILIANDYELQLIIERTKLDIPGLLRLCKNVIVTRGGEGSVIYGRKEKIEIPAVKVKKLVDPTGAGDAYRGGLIKGLIEGKDIKEAAGWGAVLASYSVQFYGTQEYQFPREEFDKILSEYLNSFFKFEASMQR